MSNPVVQWQLVTPDPAAAAQFYARLFEWGVGQDNALGYREVSSGDGGLKGGIWPGRPGERPFVQLFVSVPDVEASVKRAEELGASVIVPRTALPDGDVIAILQDPAGLPLGVCTLNGHPR